MRSKNVITQIFQNLYYFISTLESAKYRRFNFSVKTSLEAWNDENRLKMSVANVELVNYQDIKHVNRLKAEIEAMTR